MCERIGVDLYKYTVIFILVLVELGKYQALSVTFYVFLDIFINLYVQVSCYIYILSLIFFFFFKKQGLYLWVE